MNTKTQLNSQAAAVGSGALLALADAANDLNSIVEGIPSKRWAAEGRRLKDTNECVRILLRSRRRER